MLFYSSLFTRRQVFQASDNLQTALRIAAYAATQDCVVVPMPAGKALIKITWALRQPVHLQLQGAYPHPQDKAGYGTHVFAGRPTLAAELALRTSMSSTLSLFLRQLLTAFAHTPEW
eukprot:6202760-Pleurochrysis_carterae.AAC.1